MSDSKKDSNSVSLSIGDGNFRSIFSNSIRGEHHAFIVQKTEKLASALYMVTSYMSVNEPLRTRLRTCALDLVSATTGATPEPETKEVFGSRCLEIGTVLRLSERAGLVSSMNAKILCEEYAELGSFVREHHDQIFGGHIVREAKQAHPAPQQTLGHSALRTNNNKRHSNRQEMIIGLFSKKDKITIKDAVLSIEGCSEKTIQREIMTLVDEGVLIKEGERRWSTYRKAATP